MSDVRRAATVETTLGAGGLLLRGMRGHEELGRMFRYELDLLSEQDGIALGDVLGTYVTVTMEVADDAVRHFHGLVTEFSRVSAREPGERHAVYHAVVRPSFWLLTRSANCRVFQGVSVPEVVKQLLEEHGVQEVEDALTGSYRTWEYVVQYRETAFDFLSRLMEQEGIYYFFRHQRGRHTLVLADAPSAHDPAPGYDEVPYLPPGRQGRHVREHLSVWNVAQCIETGTYTLNDFDYTRPHADLEAQLSAPKPYAHADLERFDYPGEYTQTSEGESYAGVRLEALQVQCQTAHAEGNVRGLSSGALFTLSGHPSQDENTEYLVIADDFELDAGSYESGEGAAAPVFRLALTAVPSQVPYRTPRTTPRPLVSGPQTATVVGKAGEEIWTDEYGRVKVLFHWDRAGKRQGDENTSCWIRVAQVWAGAGWGAIFIPRVGQEVVVDFLEGDPDRPLITGRVYNASQMPPYSLPAHQTQSGLKSRSSKGGGQDHCNEIRFEDKRGSEQLFIQAEKDLETVVKSDERHSVGRSRSCEVGDDETLRIGGARSLSVDESESISISKSETVTVGKSYALDVGDAATVSIGKDLTLSVSKSEHHSISEARTLQIGKDDQIDVAGGRKQSVTKDELLDVGKKLVIQAGDQIVLKTGDASITLKKNGSIVIDGKDVVMKGSGKIQIKASGDVVVKGSKVTQN